MFARDFRGAPVTARIAGHEMSPPVPSRAARHLHRHDHAGQFIFRSEIDREVAVRLDRAIKVSLQSPAKGRAPSSMAVHTGCDDHRADCQDDANCHAWNPGLQSELPRAYLPLATVFRPDNVATDLATAHELSDYCGLPAHELVAFRPERLIVHELLIRVTAGVNVPDGTDYEDLGRNFRRIAATILDKYLEPHRAGLVAMFQGLRGTARALIADELARQLVPADRTLASPPVRRGWFAFGRPKPAPAAAAAAETAEERQRQLVADWSRKAEMLDHPLEAACFRALATMASAIIGRQGHLAVDGALLVNLAVTQVMNEHGSEVIGEAIAAHFEEAVVRQGYRLLQRQAAPVVMNVKGASASGKSTMRPLQKTLAAKLGLPWQDFALVSPDIWRKFLLDYGSLGPAYKYAGTLTGHEVEIIDKKLDRHMAMKAARGDMPHLLIDRFRFDSFAPTPEGRGASRLLTRFGDVVYMFFMVTPPEMTVERAWTRGLKVGRYKAVEDLLAHNVEAYTGMPELFFAWALDRDRRVHYEFLDNSVPEGSPPRTVAYGWNGEMTILDIARMLDIDRFRKINIQAGAPSEVYAGRDGAPERNADFLRRCARLIPVIHFADPRTGRPYARLENGGWAWRDETYFTRIVVDSEAKSAFDALAGERGTLAHGAGAASFDLDVARLQTLGAWGEENHDATRDCGSLSSR
jgi:hypothetical protein